MSNDNKIKGDGVDTRMGAFAAIVTIIGTLGPWGKDLLIQKNPAPLEICLFVVSVGICSIVTVKLCSLKIRHKLINILKLIRKLIYRWYDNFLFFSTESLRELLSNVESDRKTDSVDSAIQKTFTPDFGQSGSLEQKESSSCVSFIYKGVEFVLRYCEQKADFKMGGPITVKDQSSDEQKTDAPIPIPEITDAPIQEGFWIGETPVTQRQWNIIGVERKRACMFTDDDHPVESVSIEECKKFIDKFNEIFIEQLNGWKCQFPTEKEWEYACRTGKEGEDYEVSLDECAWYGRKRGGTLKVRKMKPNLWGIYDMLGNVWEWTCPPENSSLCVICGGAWNTKKKVFSSVPRDTRRKKSDGTQNIGFRIILKVCND